MKNISNVLIILCLSILVSCKIYYDVEKPNSENDKLIDNKKWGLWSDCDFGDLIQTYGYYQSDSLLYNFSIYQGKTISISFNSMNFVIHKGDTINDSRINDGLMLNYTYYFFPKKYKAYYSIILKSINDSITERNLYFNKKNSLTTIADRIKGDFIIQYHIDKTSSMSINLDPVKDRHIVIQDNSKIKMIEYEDSICYKINI